jgi:hypothetical protein
MVPMPEAAWWNDDHAAIVKLVLAAATLAVVVARALARRRWTAPDAPSAVWPARALRALGVLGLLAYVNFGAFHFSGIRVHLWDMTHYYLGAKYFDELGYNGLYACIAVADAEQPGAAARVATRVITDLRSNQMTTAAEAVAHPERCRDRFTPARWQLFTSDVAFLHARFPEQDWEALSTDHGFNASPVWVLVARPLAGQGPVTWSRLSLLSAIDPLPVVAAFAALVGAFGGETAAVVAVVFGTYFPGRFWWTGGSFLRWDWLAALLGGLALCRRGRMFPAGGLLAYAALVRVFPMFALAGAALAAVVARLRHRPIDPGLRPLLLGALSITLLLGGLAVRPGQPHGWSEFAGNLSKHTSVPSPNRMGLATVVAWDARVMAVARQGRTEAEQRTLWEGAASQTLARRRWIWLTLAAAGALAIALAVRDQPPWAACVLGLLLVPLATPAACYYYIFVAAIPLLAERRDEIAGVTLALVVAAAVVALLRLSTPVQFAAQSLLVLLAFGFIASSFVSGAVRGRSSG